MKCHILFSEKNKKNISKCCLLKILPRVLSVKALTSIIFHRKIGLHLVENVGADFNTVQYWALAK